MYVRSASVHLSSVFMYRGVADCIWYGWAHHGSATGLGNQSPPSKIAVFRVYKLFRDISKRYGLDRHSAPAYTITLRGIENTI
jgi:hypothetical protein